MKLAQRTALDPEPPSKPERKIGRDAAVTENKRLKKEIDALRDALNSEPIDLGAWYAIPEQLRDQFAARALFAESGHWGSALKRLGFRPAGMGSAGAKELFDTVFGTPGCQALLSADLSDAQEQRKALVHRMVEVGLRGSDDAAVRATQVVAKLAGWLKDEDTTRGQTVIHLWGAVAGATQNAEPKHVTTIDHQERALPSTDPLVVLGHEPGEPVRIDSGDERVHRAIEQTTDELDDA